jgi:hypothetical protein
VSHDLAPDLPSERTAHSAASRPIPSASLARGGPTPYPQAQSSPSANTAVEPSIAPGIASRTSGCIALGASAVTDQRTSKVRENRLRRAAARQGFVLRKSRRRDVRALDYGEVWLERAASRGVASPNADVDSRSDVRDDCALRFRSLDELEAFLDHQPPHGERSRPERPDGPDPPFLNMVVMIAPGVAKRLGDCTLHEASRYLSVRPITSHPSDSTFQAPPHVGEATHCQ